MRPIVAAWLMAILGGLAPQVSADDLPKPPDNAALQYWQAFPFLSSNADTLRAAKPSGLTSQLLGTNANAVRFLRRGAAMSSANWGLAYDQGIVCPTPHLDKAKHLAQAGLLWARQAASEKRWDDASEMTADVAVLSRHVAADPIYMALVTACEIQADAFQQVAEQLPVMPEDALAKFSSRLKSLSPLPSLQDAFRTQQKLVVQSGRIAAEQENAQQAQAGLAEMSELFDELIRISQLPPDQWPAAEEAFRARMRGVTSPAARSLVPGFLFKSNHAVARSQVQYRLLEAAIAAMQEGPEAVGRFTDPYLNKPIQYRKTDGGFELTSQVPIEGKPVSLSVGSAGTSKNAPAEGREDVATTAVRVFRTQARFAAAPMRICLDAAEGIDDKARGELSRLLDEFDRKVDAAAEEVRRNPPDMHTLLERAETMGEDFQTGELQKWLDSNPDAAAAIDRVQSMLEGLIDALLSQRQQILAAAARAGLPQAKQEQAGKVIEDAYTGFVAFMQRTQQQQMDAARAPKGDPWRLQTMTILIDFEIEKLQTAKKLRDKLLELLPVDRRALLDTEFVKFETDH